VARGRVIELAAAVALVGLAGVVAVWDSVRRSLICRLALAEAKRAEDVSTELDAIRARLTQCERAQRDAVAVGLSRGRR